MAGGLDEYVEKLKQNLNALPQPKVEPLCIVVSGLPGTGKSFFCRKLAERLPYPILASDTFEESCSLALNMEKMKISGFSLPAMFSLKIF